MRFRYNIGQLMLLTAAAALIVALLTTVFARVRGMFRPEAVSFSPDGSAVAARFTDGTVMIWNDAGRRVARFDTREGWLHFLQPTAMQLVDDDRLAAANPRGQFEIWEASSGRRSRAFGAPALSPFWDSSCISADGTTGAAILVSAKGGVEIWDLQTGASIRKMPPAVGAPAHIALSRDGRRLATVSHQGNVSVWDIASGQMIAGPQPLGIDFAPGSSISFSDDLSIAAAAAESFTQVRLLNVQNGKSASVSTGESDTALQLSPDGATLATIDETGGVTLTDTGDGSEIGKISPARVLPKDALDRLPPMLRGRPPCAFSPDGQQLAVGTGGEVVLYDLETQTLKRRLWGSRQSLSKWFFAPALVGWAVLWGLARRRQRLAEANPQETTVDAEVLESSDHRENDEEHDATAVLVPRRPPRSLVAVWVLLLVGGVAAIVWGTLIIFAEISCFALTPFPYYSLLAGTMLTAAAAGRRTDRLAMIHSLQMSNIICCDPLNFTLGIVGLILAHRPAALEFLRSA